MEVDVHIDDLDNEEDDDVVGSAMETEDTKASDFRLPWRMHRQRAILQVTRPRVDHGGGGD